MKTSRRKVGDHSRQRSDLLSSFSAFSLKRMPRYVSDRLMPNFELMQLVVSAI
jgi:hypothetical protein